MTDDELVAILEGVEVIATVGASTDPDKAAGSVPRRLKRIGYTVLPVNPTTDELFGETAYAELTDIDRDVDVVQVFRPADEAPGIARQAVSIGAKVLWLQLGIRSDEARRIAEGGGLTYVEDLCMANESRRLGITKNATRAGRYCT